MIKKKFKLKGKDIQKFFTSRFKKIDGENFLIYYQKNTFYYPRFTVIPKKEIFKRAVQRNKIKRKIYAIIKDILKECKIKNFDFLIFPKKSSLNELEPELKKIFN